MLRGNPVKTTCKLNHDGDFLYLLYLYTVYGLSIQPVVMQSVSLAFSNTVAYNNNDNNNNPSFPTGIYTPRYIS